MPITLTVDIDSAAVMAGLEAMPALTAVETEKAMVIGTHLIEAEVKALTPRKTGRLFSAWHSTVHGYTGIVSNNVSYAGFIEAGTAPHDIVAHGRALKFKVAGKTYFRKKVRHPGFLGRHMARLGAAAAKPLVVQVFRDAVKDAIRLAF